MWPRFQQAWLVSLNPSESHFLPPEAVRLQDPEWPRQGGQSGTGHHGSVTAPLLTVVSISQMVFALMLCLRAAVAEENHIMRDTCDDTFLGAPK